MTTVRMTEHTIPRARHRTPARSDLLGDAMLPPIGTSPDRYAQRAGDGAAPEGTARAPLWALRRSHA